MSEVQFEDIIYEKKNGVGTITFNRPEKLNAFRMQTYEEVIDALKLAGWDREVGVIVLTGAGGKAFGVGGDTGDKKSERSNRGTIGVPVDEIHTLIRDVPKPVIAKVRGYAIGGGNVLATLCTVRASWAQGGLGRPGLRYRLFGPHSRREKSKGDVVHVQALSGQGGYGHGVGQRGVSR